jgi:hypothetical protein
MADDDTSGEGPIEVPYQEPSEQEKAYAAEQAARGERITADAASLRQSLEWLQSQASSLSGSDIPDGTFRGVAGELNSVASAASTAQDGLADGVYAKSAFHSVQYWASHAAGIASTAESSASPTERQGNASDVAEAIANALSALHGV